MLGAAGVLLAIGCSEDGAQQRTTQQSLAEDGSRCRSDVRLAPTLRV